MRAVGLGIQRAACRPGLVVLHQQLSFNQRCWQTTAARPLPGIFGCKEGNVRGDELSAGRPDVKHFRDKTRSLKHPDGNVVARDEGAPQAEYTLPHTIWSDKELTGVEITHVPLEKTIDRVAYTAVQSMRTAFDFFSGYMIKKRLGTLDEGLWVRRIIFLETVAGVPGMIGGMLRHLHSLRLMRKDYGWIHTLLSEAENERMHLMIALSLRKPGIIFRSAVVVAQGVFFWLFGLLYLISPRFCHRFVGYLEEEAVKTYTHLLQEVDAGHLPHFNVVAPEIARAYYQLAEDAQLREVFSCMRADEGHHREVNHTFASMKATDTNPFPPGY